MNIIKIFAAASLALFGLVAPLDASASGPDGLGTWEGSGRAHGVDGTDLGAYAVSVTRTAVGPSKVRTDGKVYLQSGQVLNFWQEQDGGPNGFRLTSSNGQGGGRCYASGLCQLYEDRGDGHAFATTIAKDSPTQIRTLTTELEGGKAIRIMEQTLTKKP